MSSTYVSTYDVNHKGYLIYAGTGTWNLFKKIIIRKSKPQGFFPEILAGYNPQTLLWEALLRIYLYSYFATFAEEWA